MIRRGRGAWLAAGVAALLLCLPLLALIAFALPQADDFCLAALWRARGFWDGYWAFWRDWTARLPLVPAMMAPAALADGLGLPLVAAYRLVLAALALILVLALRWSAGLLLPQVTGWRRWVVAAVLLAALLAGARSPRDLLLWLGASSYYLPAGLALGLCFLLLLRPRGGWAAPPLALLAGLAVEFGGPATALIALAARLSGGRTRPCLAVVLAGLAGTAFLLLAPATGVRQAAGTEGDWLRALWQAPLETLGFLAFTVSSPAMLGWLLLVLLAGARCMPARLPLWPSALLVVALPLAAFALGLGGAGLVLPARAQQTLQLALLPPLSWLALRSGERLRLRLSPRLAWLAALLLLAGPNQWVALAELPAATRYAAAGEARLAALAGPGAATLAPLPDYPALLHQEDLGVDPADWINRCAADYFGRPSLALAAAAPPGLQPWWFLWPFPPH